MTEAKVRLTALRAWAQAARAFQCPCADDRTGWASPGMSDGPDGEMPLTQFVALAEQISREAGNPMLGWTVGLEFDLDGLGDMGEAVRSAKSLRGALLRIVDYFDLIQDAGEVRLDITGDDASFSYRILDPDIWPRRQDALFTLGIFAKIIRSAQGLVWSEAEIGLEAGAAPLKADAVKVIGANCRFDGESNFIRFPAAILDRPLVAQSHGPSPSHARLTREVALRRRRMPAALRVKTLIFQDLNEGTFNQDGVARALGMSSRTLRRRLAEEGVSFQQLLDECRMRLASFEFQVRENVSIAQTALRLGYSEHSTFTRAFSRWSGMAPQNYIRLARGGDPRLLPSRAI